MAQEKHPYNLRCPVPKQTRLLIVGTAPPPRFTNPVCGGMRDLDFDFFYGSEDNYMWQFLDEIAREDDNITLFADDMSSEDCCRAACEFLERHNIWMIDVLQTYQRRPGKECSASDQDIIPGTFTDFRSAFAPLIQLAAIAFTSEQAAMWMFEALADQNLISEADNEAWKKRFSRWKSLSVGETTREKDLKEKFEQPVAELQIEKRPIKFYLLPSPTARSRMGLKIRDKKEIYRSVLFRE